MQSFDTFINDVLVSNKRVSLFTIQYVKIG